jgi:predicted transcriptional regulator of viral defense system
MKTKLGQLEARLLAYTQMRNLRTVRTGDLTGPLRISRKQERELLSRMARGGVIVQVRRGLYLVPERLPLGGAWSPGAALVLDALLAGSGGRYQVSGPNAFHRYGFDEQVPSRVYAYNNRLSGERTVGAVALMLIKVDDRRLGGTEQVRTPEGFPMIYSSRARTLMDAVYDWSRFGSLPRAYLWISEDLRAGRIGAEDLVETTLRYGNQGTARRVGALLERVGTDEPLLKRLERVLRSAKSLIPWIPDLPRRGVVSRRWGVVFNEPD